MAELYDDPYNPSSGEDIQDPYGTPPSPGALPVPGWPGTPWAPTYSGPGGTTTPTTGNTPTVTGGGGGNGGGGGGVSAGPDAGPIYNFSAFDYPKFAPKNAAFSPLTLEQAQNEPGYKFAEQQGMDAIQRSAAAKGVLRTGGTLKDIGTWVHDFATRGYGDANQRALNTFLTNYQVEKDVYAPILAQAQLRANAEIQRARDAYARQTVWGAPRGGGGGSVDLDLMPKRGDYGV